MTKGSPVRDFARRATALLCLVCTQWVIACTSASTPGEYLVPTPRQEFELKRGDILRIIVWRQPEFSGEFEVGSDGALVHPLYQEVTVADLTLPAARQRLFEFLQTYLQGAQLVVEPLSSVTISGEVRQPSVYHLAWGATVSEAIGHAGGPTTEADLDKVRLIRDGTEYELSMRQELGPTGNIEVVSGDQIFVNSLSTFSFWRDIVVPVSVLASLTLTLILISER